MLLISRLVVGLLLLVLGRRLYWLFVAAIGFVTGPVVAAAVLLLHPGGLPYQARTLLAILALAVVFWMTEAIPLPATALLSSSLAIVNSSSMESLNALEVSTS